MVRERQTGHLHPLGPVLGAALGANQWRAGEGSRRPWFIDNAYAEWYLNSLRITGSPTWKHHLETWGKDFDYYGFVPMFNKGIAQWDPRAWAKLFRNVGARYVVLTTKHHDGFTLWPSSVQNPNRAGRLSADRDLVGDLAAAVRSEGIRMGLYYSGGLDWTFTTEPIRSIADLHARIPQSPEYARYADAHWRELIERYRPSVMWNDISYPKAGHIPELFAEYYNTVSDGVINNRFGVSFSDYTTPEYAKYDKITEKNGNRAAVWATASDTTRPKARAGDRSGQADLAADRHRQQEWQPAAEHRSKGGRVYIGDPTRSAPQTRRLAGREWRRDLRSASWVRPSPPSSDVRFTRKGDALYVFAPGGVSGRAVTYRAFERLRYESASAWRQRR